MKFRTFVILLILFVAAGVVIAWSQEREIIRHEQLAAINAGVAEYVLNPKTGSIEFRYKSSAGTAASTPTPAPQPTVTPDPSIVGPPK